MTESYVAVTELPGSGATREQLAMLYTRYHLAAGLSAGKDVLEVACGPGVGLGNLARRARKVVGGDYDERMVRQARSHYGSRIPLCCLDAQRLPLADRSFDLVILFEALYYLAAPERFVDEARRVLRPQGVVLISTVNRDWPGFNPSPFSHRYFSAPELRALLESGGFVAEMFGGFSATAATPRDLVLALVRQLAVSLHLIPPTMKAKQLLKRLVFGRLTPIPSELEDGAAGVASPVPLAEDVPSSAFKVLYGVGRA